MTSRHAKFGVSMAMMIQVTGFWLVTLCSGTQWRQKGLPKCCYPTATLHTWCHNPEDLDLDLTCLWRYNVIIIGNPMNVSLSWHSESNLPCFHSQPSLSGLKNVCIRSLPSSSGILNGSVFILSYKLCKTHELTYVQIFHLLLQYGSVFMIHYQTELGYEVLVMKII
jgi:hypothetical protein